MTPSLKCNEGQTGYLPVSVYREIIINEFLEGSRSERRNESAKMRAPKFLFPYIHQVGWFRLFCFTLFLNFRHPDFGARDQLDLEECFQGKCKIES